MNKNFSSSNLMCAIASTLNKDKELIRNLFVKNDDNLVHIALFGCGVRIIPISTTIPFDTSSASNEFCYQSYSFKKYIQSNPNQKEDLWCVMLEKAVAKLFGSYLALKTKIDHEDSFFILTGNPSDYIDYPLSSLTFRRIKRQFEELSSLLVRGALVMGQRRGIVHKISINADSVPGEIEEPSVEIFRWESIHGDDSALKIQKEKKNEKGEVIERIQEGASSQWVAVLGTFVYKGERLVKCSDPLGVDTYKGDWDDTSNKWTADAMTKLGVQKLDPRDGYFYVPFSVFRQGISRLQYVSSEGGSDLNSGLTYSNIVLNDYLTLIVIDVQDLDDEVCTRQEKLKELFPEGFDEAGNSSGSEVRAKFVEIRKKVKRSKKGEEDGSKEESKEVGNEAEKGENSKEKWPKIERDEFYYTKKSSLSMFTISFGYRNLEDFTESCSGIRFDLTLIEMESLRKTAPYKVLARTHSLNKKLAKLKAKLGAGVYLLSIVHNIPKSSNIGFLSVKGNRSCKIETLKSNSTASFYFSKIVQTFYNKMGMELHKIPASPGKKNGARKPEFRPAHAPNDSNPVVVDRRIKINRDAGSSSDIKKLDYPLEFMLVNPVGGLLGMVVRTKSNFNIRYSLTLDGHFLLDFREVRRGVTLNAFRNELYTTIGHSIKRGGKIGGSDAREFHYEKGPLFVLTGISMSEFLQAYAKNPAIFTLKIDIVD